jgi:hypothetical protein
MRLRQKIITNNKLNVVKSHSPFVKVSYVTLLQYLLGIGVCDANYYPFYINMAIAFINPI